MVSATASSVRESDMATDAACVKSMLRIAQMLDRWKRPVAEWQFLRCLCWLQVAYVCRRASPTVNRPTG